MLRSFQLNLTKPKKNQGFFFGYRQKNIILQPYTPAMLQKLFPLDKNYLFRQAQSNMEERLLEVMVEELKSAYTLWYNPLGLVDDTYRQILVNKDYPKKRISIIYEQLCGIYRYQHPNNQLELLFD